MNKIETIVRNYIVRHGMWKHDGSYIVALSGGADSVALLLILKNLGMPIHAAHCNFHLRGEESERDEQFCVDLCEREGICLHRIHFDTLTYAEKHKVSIEMAARICATAISLNSPETSKPTASAWHITETTTWKRSCSIC